MRCSVVGCEREARGAVETVPYFGAVVPAHECRFCLSHPCEMERYVSRRSTVSAER